VNRRAVRVFVELPLAYDVPRQAERAPAPAPSNQ
jgi:hypothetical protein